MTLLAVSSGWLVVGGVLLAFVAFAVWGLWPDE